MTIQELQDEISRFIILFLVEHDLNDDINIPETSIEVVARLLTLSFINADQMSSSYSNINAFNREWHSQSSESFDADLMAQRRFSKKLHIAYKNMLKQIPSSETIPDITEMDNNRVGRIYDRANLLFISKNTSHVTLDLLDYIYKDRICDSKSVSDEKLVKAYEDYDKEYKIAQKETDKKRYIYNWVNLYRREVAYHLSLIPQIAQEMLDRNIKDVPAEWLQKIFGNINIDGMISFSYQIRNYQNYISPLLELKSADDFNEFFDFCCLIRIIESVCVMQFSDKSNLLLQSFFEGESQAIEDVYQFCHLKCPIIEEYANSNLYFCQDKNNQKALNHPKIKLVRKLIRSIISPEELKKMFQKAP